MNRYFAELSLSSLKVTESFRLDDNDINTLTVTLFYPRSGVPAITTVKSLKLVDKQTIDFVNGTNPETGAPYGLPDRTVFREEVLGGAFHLAAFLTAIDKPSKLDEFMALLFGTVFKGLWEAAGAGATNLILAGVVSAVGAAHVGSFKREKDPIYCIGKGERQLDLASFEGPLDLSLEVPEDIAREGFSRVTGGKKPQLTELVKLKKSAKNGSLGLALTVSPMA